MDKLSEWLPALALIGAFFIVPLALWRTARASYVSAARVVAASFMVVSVLAMFGTAIVAPLVWSEQLGMAAAYAAIATLIYILWCVLIVRRNRL